MPIVTFKELMTEAERGQYAVGYFESWNLESLQAVANAAEAMRSPVILGFSGIYFARPSSQRKEPLSVYSTLGTEMCRQLSVPACLLFNECPDFDRVLEAVRLRFGLVMFTNESLDRGEQMERVSQIVAKGREVGVSVEGELISVPGMSGGLSAVPDEKQLTDVSLARDFVERTGVDALAVNVGQAHLHGRREVSLDLSRLQELRKAVSVPLVLHGGSSVTKSDLQAATRLGIRKINVGSILKQAYFEALRSSCPKIDGAYNPYEIIGSGLDKDVLTQATREVQMTVENLMRLFGSAGRAW